VLQLYIPAIHYSIDTNNEDGSLDLGETKAITLQLEHSLVSLSKWESKWKKPFLSKDAKTREETIDYFKHMTITKNVDPLVFEYLPTDIFTKIEAYIEDSMTATWFSDKEDHKKSKDIITAEIIYYWMIAQNIPMECQKWHLNRLMTLIRVCSIKNAPDKKVDKRAAMTHRGALNQARRAKMNSKG